MPLSASTPLSPHVIINRVILVWSNFSCYWYSILLSGDLGRLISHPLINYCE